MGKEKQEKQFPKIKLQPGFNLVELDVFTHPRDVNGRQTTLTRNEYEKTLSYVAGQIRAQQGRILGISLDRVVVADEITSARGYYEQEIAQYIWVEKLG